MDTADIVSNSIALAALIFAGASWMKSERTARAMLVLEQARDEEARQARRRAELRARFVSGGAGRFNELVLENTGQAPARHVRIWIDEDEVGRAGEADSFYQSDRPPAILASGAPWRCQIFTSAMTSDRLHVRATWTDESGIEGIYESELSLE
jgi:hypothetical protein